MPMLLEDMMLGEMRCLGLTSEAKVDAEHVVLYVKSYSVRLCVSSDLMADFSVSE